MKLDRVIAVRNTKTVYRDGDRAIKIFTAEYSKSDVLSEALNHARAEETGLNIPKILGITTIDGKWAIVSEFIKGKTLSQLMQENPEIKNEYMELFVDLQMSVHQRTAPLLNKLRDKISCKLEEVELDTSVLKKLQDILENMPNHNNICHGDFTPSNVIITENGTPYILDWSHATQGNALADVACTYLLFMIADNASEAELYLDTFCEKSDTKKHEIQKWLPVVAACKSLKANETERCLLANWLI